MYRIIHIEDFSKLIEYAINNSDYISVCSFIGNTVDGSLCAVSLCFSGGMSVGKINKYNRQFINRLKKNNWKIIKDGIKTFFKHIKPHFKKYLSNNVFVSIFGVGAHSMSKAAVKRVGYSY